MAQQLRRTSLEAAELIAATDPKSFEFLLAREGLSGSRAQARDPLHNVSLPEEIQSIAQVMNEDLSTPRAQLDPYRNQLIRLGGDYGYLVG